MLSKASFNKKEGAFREEVEDSGILLTDPEFQTAQRKLHEKRRGGKRGRKM